MELVANVWPVVDEQAMLVQRFMIRAYAVEADDAAISALLTTLAPTDYLLARVFPIPARFRQVSPHGELVGCVSLTQFHQQQFSILEPAFRALEADHAPLQGIAVTGTQPVGTGKIPRFPENPYLVTTVLLETPDGRLIPQIEKP